MSMSAQEASLTKSSRAAPPDLAEMLLRIDARLERLERALGPALALAEQVPQLVATLTDVVDEKAARLGDLEPRLQALGEIAEHLSRPSTLATLRKVVEIAENAPALVATMTDIMDEVMADAAKNGLELSQVIDDIKRLSFGLLKLMTSAELRALMDSGVLDPRALTALGHVATALTMSGESPPPRVGALGALRALGNQDVQRALGFVLRVAENLGRNLASDAAVAPAKQLPPG